MKKIFSVVCLIFLADSVTGQGHGLLPLIKGEVGRGLNRHIQTLQPPFNSPLHKGGESKVVPASAGKASLQVEVQKTLAALEKDEDTDGDKRITVNEPKQD